MTAPGGSVGTAYISFHARTDRLQPELEAALRDVSNDADDFLDRAGTQWGETVSDSTSREIRRHGRDFADSIEHALTGQVISLGGARYKVDRRGFLHDFDTGQFAGKLIDDVIQAFEGASQKGGPFSQVGEGIADAIGAGFNVSGKSPLIALLIPTFGAIAGAIAAVVQMVNALAAVLTTIPALVAAIGLQAGTLMLAFNGVGKAISGAFAAKNWNEFYAAIQGLTPAAQNFIVTLLPLRDLIRDLKASTQESFFSGFGNTMVNIVQQLGPVLRSGLPQIANALGNLFKQVGLFFASPTFVGFINNVIPATLRWLGQFGPGFTSFLSSLINMANTALPFLERLGQTVTGAFGIFTSWLNDQIASGGLTDWLDRMSVTIDKVVKLFFNLSTFVVNFLDALDRAGGNDLITQFGDLFQKLGEFLGTEAGQAAMAGFVHAVEALTYSFSGLIFTLMSVLIAFEAVLQFFNFVGTAFQGWIDWLFDTAIPALYEFFMVTVPGYAEGLGESIRKVFEDIGYYIRTGFGLAVDWVVDKWNEFVDWFQGKVGEIVNFFVNVPEQLANIGRDLMQGLWDGLMWGWNHTVKPVLDWITSQIPEWKGPLEKDKKLLKPSGRALMSGLQEGMKQGAEDLKGMLGAFTNNLQATGMSNVFNTNLNFLGQQPTVAEARSAGAAVSGEIEKKMNVLDTRLAVRMA